MRTTFGIKKTFDIGHVSTTCVLVVCQTTDTISIIVEKRAISHTAPLIL